MLAFLRMLWFRISSLFNRRRLERDLSDELQLHRELLEDEARQHGADASAARREAALRLGNETSIRERSRDWWSFAWLEAVAQDTRYSLRFLARSPGFTFIAILSLALGIGANAAVFTVVDRLLLSAPAHITEPGSLHLVNVRRIRREGEPRPFYNALTFPEAFALRTGNSFATVTPYMAPSRVRLGRGPDAPRIKESLVDGAFFRVLGVKPVRGRFFAPDDDREGAEPAAVISHAFWQRQFGGADSAIGSRIRTSALEITIIGVAPEEFTGVEMDAADYWITLGAAAPTRIQKDWKNWRGFAVRAVVRLNPGVTLPTADAEGTLLLRRIPDRQGQAPTEETVALGPVIAARGPAEQSAEVKVSTRLVIASGLVLLAACANLANLLLVRALARRREIAMRLAIGISRRRLVGQMAVEALLIAFAGTAAALLVAQWAGGALRTLVFPTLQWSSGTVNLRVIVFAATCAVAVSLLATIAPAIRMTRADVSKALRSAAPQLVMSTGRLRQGLLVLQVALSVLLVVGGAVFAQSLRRAYEFDMGVDLDRIVVTRLFLEADTIGGAGRRLMMEEGARRARTIAGVERVALATSVPLLGNSVQQIRVPGQDSAGLAVLWEVTPELVPTVGFRVLRGRTFTEDDVRAGGSAILATETLATRLFRGQDPIGRCARVGADTSPCLTIVGVVRDLRQWSLRDEEAPAALVAVAEPELNSSTGAYIVTRTNGDTKRLVPELQRLFRDIHPDMATMEIRRYSEALDHDYRPLRLGSAMFGSFAVLAVFLAAVGLYGVLSFTVTQRTSEFGVRAALGAHRGRIVRHVMGGGLGIVGAGLALGGLASWFASSAIQSLLFNTEVRAVTPYAVAALVLGLVAVIASAIPAWRASSVDPAIALRAE